MSNHPRYIRHLRIRSSNLQAIIHEAWKAGNESDNIHEHEDGTAERYAYVSKVMADNNFIDKERTNVGSS